MSLFSWFKSQVLPAESLNNPSFVFGRYSDSYKSAEQYEAWEHSLSAFAKKQYLEAYRHLFHYMEDELKENISLIEDESGQLNFTILQGSLQLVGHANVRQFKAVINIAHADQLSIGFMRRLLEQNYDLKYARYALSDDNFLTMLFDTSTLDGSPYKVYYALKEMATSADKQDDLLLKEFEQLTPILHDHLMAQPEFVKEVKYEYLQEEIANCLAHISQSTLNPDQYPGAVAYQLLELCYRLDYLLKPEGEVMEILERIHRKYFSAEGKNMAQKNQVIFKEFQSIRNIPKTDFFKELYDTKCTFGITTSINHDRLAQIIEGEFMHLGWYVDNEHFHIAEAICGYTVCHSLFNFALPKPDKLLFELFLQVQHQAYFESLGYSFPFFSPQPKVKLSAIKRAVQAIEAECIEGYSILSYPTELLEIDSPHVFARSFLEMVKQAKVEIAG